MGGGRVGEQARSHEHGPGDVHGHGGHSHEAHAPGRWSRLRHNLSHLNPFGHSHESSDSVDDALESSEEGIRALKLSLVLLGITAVFQLFIVILSGSVALLADTVHNFNDALTALPLWLAFALSRWASNRRYTYGYNRAEDLAGVFIVAMIAFSAAYIGYESVMKLIEGSEMSNVGWVAVAGVIGFLGNEIVAQIRMRAGRRIGSAALIADGQHARVDGFTSIAVLGAAVGVWLGYPIADPIIGLLITLVILFIVKDAAISMWRRMMDAVEPEIVDSIEEAAMADPRVDGVESVRARWVGHRIYSEVEIGVNGGASTSEVAQIREKLSAEAKRRVPKLERLVVEAVPRG
jgi:cation diffusion facilitator family transporter